MAGPACTSRLISRCTGRASVVERALPPHMAAAMHEFITFASQAKMLAIWAGGLIALAVLAAIMERRRMRRREINRVGWVPWTGLFLTSAVLAAGLLAVAVPALVRG